MIERDQLHQLAKDSRGPSVVHAVVPGELSRDAASCEAASSAMSPGRPEAPQVIENALSGERIVITGPPGNGHGMLAWDLYLSPGGRVPNSHLHPSQEERFHVRGGRVQFRVDGRRVLAGPGDIVRVPAGTAHHFANAGPGTAWARVETWPALNMVAMFKAAAEMARQQQAAGRAVCPV